MTPQLIILGGMGPMAGIYMHQMLARLDKRASRDQAHLDVIHISCAGKIPDRSEFLMGRGLTNPGKVAASILAPHLAVSDSQGCSNLVIVPCATFHASKIMDAFFQASEPDLKQRFVSLLPPAVSSAKRFAAHGKIGYLATEGAVASGVWRKEIEAQAYIAATVGSRLQAMIQDAIYNPVYGIKAVSSPTRESVSALNLVLKSLNNQGIKSVVLGCTELSLVAGELDNSGLILIDPMYELAHSILGNLEENIESAAPHETRESLAPAP